MFYSSDEKLMEKYEIQIPDIYIGSNYNSDFNHIENRCSICFQPEISDNHEYNINDVTNNIYTSTPIIDVTGNVLLHIKQEYWHISKRLWLLDLIKTKTLKIEGVVTSDGDYENADKNSEYYQVRITPPFTDDEIEENLLKIKPEDRDVLLIDRKYIDRSEVVLLLFLQRKRRNL